MLDRLAPLTPPQRLALLGTRLPDWLAPFATRYRYVTLALVINMPGNSLLGGGGGLGILAGLSRLFHLWPTLLTFVLAVAPVPLFVWITGSPLTWFSG